jgi:hypothetical protein
MNIANHITYPGMYFILLITACIRIRPGTVIGTVAELFTHITTHPYNDPI